MAYKVAREQQPKHEHFWQTWQDSSADTCLCGYLRVSQQELESRSVIWEKYNQDIITTPAYQDYLEMKTAFKSKHTEKMQEIRKRIETRGHWGENNFGEEVWVVDQVSFEKPHFPNPISWIGYVLKEESATLPW